MATLEDYRNNTGVFAEESADVQDAAVQEEQIGEPETEEVGGTEDFEESPEDIQDTFTDDEQEEEQELSPKEKTAFEKRLEREKRKMEEELSKQIEAKYSKHQKVIEKLGGDPDKIEQMLAERQIQSEIQAQAQQLAEYNGWDDSQTQWYVQQQTQVKQQELQQLQLQKELQELRIANQINDLRDNPDFPGIIGLKKDIADLVSKSNGTLDVTQAYWALGGQARAQQMKREAEQRAAVQRRTRVVAKDTPSAASTEKVIPGNILAQAKQMGISEKELRELADFDAKNINEYRAKKKK
ncbi:hypothetical protein [Paenibacillus macerans]|uniref:hypothetical protein n=1 Tax=Paenibacillus macerans TaxID=44252 RepID=UPI00203F2B03|nr:hypothetical protein [Paenibacillus macerans]MCM3703801.1 hypothetical protein [Paenibacillus macerans]